MQIGIASEWIGERVGGLERQSVDLMRAMMALDEVNSYRMFVTPRGAETLRLGEPRATVHATAFNSRWYYVPVGLPLALLRHRVDLLHATFTVTPWCRAGRIVLTVHDVCPDEHPEFFPNAIRARFRWLMKQGVACADKVIVPSHATRSELLRHYHVRDEKVVVIPNGVRQEIAARSPVARPFDERNWPARFILYVGRFHARKNIERLVEAFARSRSRQNGVRLVLAGRDLWSGERVMKRVAELGLEGDVVCPGYVDDTTLGELYRRARVFAFPSLHEGFGIPPLEAMAYRVPVLACRVSAMPEVLGDAAYYSDPYDIDDMAASLDRLIEDDALRADLIRRGCARARVYSWPRVAAETLDLYQRVSGLS